MNGMIGMRKEMRRWGKGNVAARRRQDVYLCRRRTQ